ncbi:MAG: fibronectin type III domain-containing protein, partial [Hyphomicrobiales bacterium]|nr:fibronectin type III domain-containing protein [Hyphomicrobiales bacterium]
MRTMQRQDTCGQGKCRHLSARLALAGALALGAWLAAAAPAEAQTPFPSRNARPSAPTITVTPGNEQLTVQWSVSNIASLTNIRGVELRYKKPTDSDFRVIRITDFGNFAASASQDGTYIIKYLENGATYQVEMRSQDVRNLFSDWTRTRATPALVAPAAPRLRIGDKQLGVAWTPSDYESRVITSYDVRSRKSDTAVWIALGASPPGAASSPIIDGLENGIEYEVQVRARNAPDASAWSDIATAVPASAPAAPTVLRLTPGDRQLAVAWSAPDDGGSPITRYEVGYKPTGQLFWDNNERPRGTITSLTLANLNNGQSYDVRLRAENRQGASPWSATTTIALPVGAPAAPARLTLVSRDMGLEVRWDAPDDGGSPITHYVVQWKRTSDRTYTSLPNIAASARSAQIMSLVNLQTYQVQVRAVSGSGASGWSDAAGAPGMATAPDAPTDVRIVPIGRFLEVIWNAPANTGGLQGGSPASITGYQVRWSRAGTNDWRPANSSTVVVDPNDRRSSIRAVTAFLMYGQTYDVQVQATNSVGQAGPWSSIVQGRPMLFPAPPAPSAVAITPGYQRLLVSWQPPEGLFEAGGLVSYKIRWKLASDTTYPLANMATESAARDPNFDSDDPRYNYRNNFNFVISSLINGQTYDVVVSATSVYGDEGASSAALQGTPMASRPTAPDIPDRIIAGDRQLTVSWSAPSHNGGSPITGYVV